MAEGHFSEPEFPAAVDCDLRPEWPLGVAAQWTVLRYFRDLLGERDKVMANEDPEGVHQIRVAARRVRTALQTFSTLWQPKDLKRYLQLFGDFADVFTEARDTDVMLIYLDEQLKTARMPRRSALIWLRETAARRREEEQPRLEKVLHELEKNNKAAKIVNYFSRHPFDLGKFDPQTGEFRVPAASAPDLPVPQAPQPEVTEAAPVEVQPEALPDPEPGEPNG